MQPANLFTPPPSADKLKTIRAATATPVNARLKSLQNRAARINSDVASNFSNRRADARGNPAPTSAFSLRRVSGRRVMRTLWKLSSFVAAAGLSVMLAAPFAPAYASVQGRDTLLGAGIGAVAGGLLGHGKIGPVLGGAAVGAAAGALAAPHHKHHATYYDRYGRRHNYVYYTGRRAYDRYGYYNPYGHYRRG